MVKIKKYTISLILISSVLFTDKSSSGQTTYIPRYNTIAHKMLHIEDSLKLDFPGYKIFPDYKTLDALIDNSKTYITKKQNYSKEDIEKIVKKIYSDMINKIPEVKNRKQICYETSLIYLAIGQENNLPFYAVTVPGTPEGHIFVRYDPNGEHDALNPNSEINKGDLDIETTSGKIHKDNNFLPIISDIKKENYKKAIEKGIYLKNLNEKELLSISYWNKAGKNIENQEYEKAIENCNKAIQLNPTSVQAYQIKGMTLKIENNPNKDYKKSIESFTKAIELNPEPTLYSERAKSLRGLKKYNESLEDYTIAIKKLREFAEDAGSFYRFYDLKYAEINCLIGRALTFCKMKDLEKSEKDVNKAQKLAEKYFPDLYNSK